MKRLILVILLIVTSRFGRAQCSLEATLDKTWIRIEQFATSDSSLSIKVQIQLIIHTNVYKWRVIVDDEVEEQLIAHKVTSCDNNLVEMKIPRSKNNQGGFAYVRWFEESLILGFSDDRIPIEEIDDSEIIWLDFKLLK